MHSAMRLFLLVYFVDSCLSQVQTCNLPDSGHFALEDG
jgi:hypothetical protein